MEVIRHQQPRSSYGAAGLYNPKGRVRNLHEKEIRVARSRDNTSTCYSNCEPPPRNRVGIVSKLSPQLSWWNDKDVKRKRRVATYKLYAAHGKLKSSLQKGFHRFKITCKKILT